MGYLSVISGLLIYPAIYLYQCRVMDMYLKLKKTTSFYLLYCPNFYRFDLEKLSVGSCTLLTIPSMCGGLGFCFCLLQYFKMFQLTLYIPCPRPRISNLSKQRITKFQRTTKISSTLIGKWQWNQDPRSSCVLTIRVSFLLVSLI